MSEWRKVEVYEREAACHDPECDYMGIETWRSDRLHAWGLCTKCGKSWDVSDAPSLSTQGHLNAMATEVREINVANGWEVPCKEDWDRPNRIPTLLALMHSEVSEALEGFRAGDRENVAEEMADVVIRVLDFTGGLGIDLDKEIADKMAKNRKRGYRHGGKRI